MVGGRVGKVMVGGKACLGTGRDKPDGGWTVGWFAAG